MPSIKLSEIISDANNPKFVDAINELEERRELSLLEVSSDDRAIAARVRIFAADSIYEHKNQLADLLSNFDFSDMYADEDKEKLLSVSNKVKFLMSENATEKEKIINDCIKKYDYESCIFFGIHIFLGKEFPKNTEKAVSLLSAYRGSEIGEYGLGLSFESLANTLIFFYYSSIENHWDLDSELERLEYSEPLLQKFLCLYLNTKANNPDQINNKFAFHYDESWGAEAIDFLSIYMEDKHPAHIVTGTDLKLAVWLAEIYPEEILSVKNKLFAKFNIPPEFKSYSSQDIENWIIEKYGPFKGDSASDTDESFKRLLPENLIDLVFDDDKQTLLNHYLALQKPISHLFIQLEISRLKLCLNTVEFCELIGISRQAYYGWKSGVPIRKANHARINKIIEQGLAQIENGLWPNEQVVLNPDENKAKLLMELILDDGLLFEQDEK